MMGRLDKYLAPAAAMAGILAAGIFGGFKVLLGVGAVMVALMSVMPQGPAVILPLVLGTLLSIFGVGQKVRQSQELEESIKPGAEPGTVGPDEPPLFPTVEGTFLQNIPGGENLLSQLNELSQLSPVAAGIFSGLAERADRRKAVQDIADQVVGLFQNSDLPNIRDRLESRIPRIESIVDTSTARARSALDKASASVDRGSKALQQTVDDPTVITKQEMQQIINGIVGSSNQQLAAQAGLNQQRAAARGVSPAALNVLENTAAVQQLNEQQRIASNVILQNALAEASRRDAAAGLLASQIPAALTGISTAEGQLGGLGLQGEGLVRDVLGLSGNLDRAFRGDLANALAFRASTEIPLPVETISQALAAENLQNLGLSQQAIGDLANTLLQVGLAGLGFGFDRLNAKDIADAQKPDNNVFDTLGNFFNAGFTFAPEGGPFSFGLGI